MPPLSIHYLQNWKNEKKILDLKKKYWIRIDTIHHVNNTKEKIMKNHEMKNEKKFNAFSLTVREKI